MPTALYYMRLAKSAREASKDRSRQCGAVIVGPAGNVISTGYNGFPMGVNDNIDERHERPAKYMWTEHSERNAIYFAARAGVSTVGCTMYCYADQGAVAAIGSCADCARAIIQSGIVKLVIQAPDGEIAEQWGESVGVGLTMLKEAGVVVFPFHGEV